MPHSRLHPLAALSLVAVLGSATSCAPLVSYRVDMRVGEDGVCERRVAVTARPNPKNPGQRVDGSPTNELQQAA